jgi:phosphatidate cytidylyltransferase
MALNLPTFYKRLGSAIVFSAIMLAGLLWNKYAFLALALLINALCLRDYFRLMQKIDKEAHWPAWLPVATQLLPLIVILPYFFLYGETLNNTNAAVMLVWAIVPIAPALLLLGAVLGNKQALPAILQSFGGLLYISLPIMLLIHMQLHDYLLPIMLILMIWSNDTFAYLVGSFIGKTPFSPISPKKTWEGTIGGALLTIGGAIATCYFTHTYRLIDWIAFALCAAVAGTLGDLLESKLKRMADVKDSGALMPGHGGALDRFDSLIVAAPFVFVYVSFFMRG